MNVLVVTNMYPTEKNPFYGIFVKEQVDSMRAAGVLTDVYFINGIENRFNYFKSIIDLVKKIKCKKYNLIHAHHSYCIFPIKIAKIITGVKAPVVFTFHEGEVHLRNKLSLKNTDFIKRLVFSKKVKSMALKMVDLVIAVQEEMIKRLNFNGKSIVLPCGVDTDLFKPMEKEWCRKRLNLPHDKKIIFFPASPANKQKGFDILREAIKYLDRKDLHSVVGGNILHEDMTYYMNAADVVVQLSIFEASPSVLKEALAVNVPLVFTDAGDTKMIVGNTKGCFLCKRSLKDVALKLEKAINCDGACNGRHHIFEINLTLKAVSESIIKVYSDLLLEKG